MALNHLLSRVSGAEATTATIFTDFLKLSLDGVKINIGSLKYDATFKSEPSGHASSTVLNSCEQNYY